MPGSVSPGSRQELGRQAKASGVDAHIGRSKSGPKAGRRAGGHRRALRLGSKWQRMGGPVSGEE